IVLFILPIAVFTNVHIIHDYYQTANAIFIVAAISFLVSELIAARKPILASFVVVLLIFGSLARFYFHQWPAATAPLFGHWSYLAGKMVEKSTPEESSLIVLGLDWSSEVNYYAKRKGLALPVWATPQEARMILSNPDAAMGGLKVGAVVDCRS